MNSKATRSEAGSGDSVSTNRPRSVTLADLAKAAGVSRTTASNAFNRPDQLSSELRDRVLTMARTLGYPGPNPMARMLRTGRAGSIGLVFADSIPYAFTDPASLALLRGIGEICEREHAAIVILPVEQSTDIPPAVYTAAVDGFLVYCVPDDAPVLEALKERGLPAIGIDQHGFDLGPSVVIDDEAAAFEAARHLIELGHQRFGILSLDLTHNSKGGSITRETAAETSFSVTRLRLNGYFRALRQSGFDPFEQRLHEIAFNSRQTAEQIVRAWLDDQTRPTAILAMSDQLALGALHAATAKGVDVPHQLSIVGFDNTEQGKLASPPLTTIQQPIIEKGRIAAKLLLGSERRQTHRLKTELIIRGSTAPAPQAGEIRGASPGAGV